MSIKNLSTYWLEESIFSTLKTLISLLHLMPSSTERHRAISRLEKVHMFVVSHRDPEAYYIDKRTP